MDTFRQYSTERKIITVSGILGILLCCLFATQCNSLSPQTIADAKVQTRSLILAYAHGMAKKDYDTVYALFSKRVHRQMSIEEIEEFGDVEANFAIVDGIQSVEINSLKLLKQANTNPNMPQGSVATVIGIANFDDGFTGRVDAVFELESETWRIHHINISISPERLQNYLENR